MLGARTQVRKTALGGLPAWSVRGKGRYTRLGSVAVLFHHRFFAMRTLARLS